MTAVLDAAPPAVLGKTTPRLWTRPLITGPPGPCGCGCAFTPETTWGFEAAAFAEQVLGLQLYPWQRWWLIHAFEIDPATGRLRFRTLLTLIARQNGKTLLLKVVALWLMYMGRARLILGVAQSLDIARESWWGAVELAREKPDLAVELADVRRGSIDQSFTLASGARYKISAATPEAGRGLSVDLLVMDELRAQYDSDAWAALSKTTSARANGLIVGISNAGSDRAVVLNSLRSAALAATEPTLGVFEWSAPDGAALEDRDGWAQANPALGRGLFEASIRTSLATDPPAVFRTEVLCQHVDALDSAVDLEAWKVCEDRHGDLAAVRDRLVLCLDVAPDGQHITLAGAAELADGRVRVEPFGAWTSTEKARVELVQLLKDLRPRALGWYPSGPGAVLGVELAEQHGVTIGLWTVRKDAMRPYAPGVVELKGETVTQACQTFADLVLARQVLHPADPLFDAHVKGSKRLRNGDGWRFARRDAGHCDAAYALAGAVHLARSLPAPAPPPRSAVY